MPTRASPASSGRGQHRRSSGDWTIHFPISLPELQYLCQAILNAIDLKTVCSRCNGLCCKNSAEGIAISIREIKKLSTHFNMRPAKFRQKYMIDATHLRCNPCHFWDKGCSFYPFRPEACKRFPLGQNIIGSPCIVGDHILQKIFEKYGIDLPAYPSQDICIEALKTDDYAGYVMKAGIGYQTVGISVK